MWTSNSTKSFITVTEHHIDHKWDLQTNVLVMTEKAFILPDNWLIGRKISRVTV